MAFLMTAAEALTEEINNIGNIDTSETMENLEKLKDVDPNKVVEYFKGKIPDFISFGMTVLLALVIYFIGSRLIKLLRRIVRRSLERSQVDTGVVQFVDALVKAIAYAVLLLTIISLFGIETTSADPGAEALWCWRLYFHRFQRGNGTTDLPVCHQAAHRGQPCHHHSQR